VPNGSGVVQAIRGRLGFGGALATFYGCMFFVLGVAMPYLNPWLASRGMSVSEIAIIASVAPLVRIMAVPVFGFLADRYQAHRAYLISLSWISFGAWILFSQGSTFWSFLAAQVLVSATGAALMPMADTMAVAGVKSHGIDYGRVRLWGSITFMIATVVSGWLVDWRGIGITIELLIAAVALTALSSLLLPFTQPRDTGLRKPLSVVDAAALVKSPAFLLFLLVAGLAQSAHATLYVFSTLHWQKLGLSNAWCGALWAIAVVAEIALFWAAPTFSRRIGPLHLLGAGLAASVLRWTAMGFDPPLALLIPLQVLHGLTYGASHLGAIQFMARAIPSTHAGTGQSVYALVCAGLGSALATQMSGVAYLAWGGGAYWLMAGLAAIGLITLTQLAARWSGDEISVAGSPAAGRE
jgi:MFS transporter, PPP family, 3-phenylpropionic acid transporter